MLKRLWFIPTVGLLFLIGDQSSISANAEEIICPQTIAHLESNPLTDQLLPEIINGYESLGCKTRFIPLPGRRAIQKFNSGEVDGELFRINVVEEQYERPFVRSSVPIITLLHSLWVHPDYVGRKDLPIGYAIGALWQEEYVEGKLTRRYHNGAEVFDAYVSGQVQFFIATDITIYTAIKDGTLKVAPVKVQTIIESQLYHYLDEKYAPFMDEFSKFIKTEDPFKLLLLLRD